MIGAVKNSPMRWPLYIFKYNSRDVHQVSRFDGFKVIKPGYCLIKIILTSISLANHCCPIGWMAFRGAIAILDNTPIAPVLNTHLPYVSPRSTSKYQHRPLRCRFEQHERLKDSAWQKLTLHQKMRHLGVSSTVGIRGTSRNSGLVTQLGRRKRPHAGKNWWAN